MCWSLFLIKLQVCRCFPVKFAKFLRTSTNGCFYTDVTVILNSLITIYPALTQLLQWKDDSSEENSSHLKCSYSLVIVNYHKLNIPHVYILLLTFCRLNKDKTHNEPYMTLKHFLYLKPLISDLFCSNSGTRLILYLIEKI